MANCPNCGGDLVSKLEIKDDQGVVTDTVEPSGGIQVCPDCNMAVDPKEAQEGDTEAPPPEASPRGEEGPERVEDQPDYEAGAVDATPAAEELASKEGVDLTQVEGTGAEGRVTKSDVEDSTQH